MSDTAGLDKAKGTLIHCCRGEIEDINIVIKSSNHLIALETTGYYNYFNIHLFCAAI